MNGKFRNLGHWRALSLPACPLPADRQRYFHTLSRLYLIATVVYLFDFIPMFWLLADTRLFIVSVAGLGMTLVARELHRRGYMGAGVLLMLATMTAHMLVAIGTYGSGLGFELYFALILLVTYISALSQVAKLGVSLVVMGLTTYQLMGVPETTVVDRLGGWAPQALLIANLATLGVLFAVILRRLEGVSQRLEISYRRQAHHDALTGVFNRRAVLREVELAMDNARPFALLMIDIDHFKPINDRYGHKRGDRALCHLVECLRESLRDEDTLGRYGGEEFIAVLHDKRHGEALCAAERLAATVRETPYALDGGDLHMTVSIGVAANGEALDIDGLIALADRRLYQAKRDGRDQVCGDDAPSMQDASPVVLDRAAEQMRAVFEQRAS
ncbi:GGDEF domain-containing protein [Modicisalibacter radicis]|uniref:GGDEF domain-containing protein n=1 Tax=Halomonas sp. EAR18 TaxID=2518972 RepID=UPI00109C7AAD|nr:GGDEF domain-containing protein [Halomonas sp. EAR18]